MVLCMKNVCDNLIQAAHIGRSDETLLRVELSLRVKVGRVQKVNLIARAPSVRLRDSKGIRSELSAKTLRTKSTRASLIGAHLITCVATFA
jgi:hypothetical protein